MSRGRPASRAFHVRVLRISQITEHFTRVTFGGDSLRWFGSGGYDQRIKLLFPLPGNTLPQELVDEPEQDLMEWYREWRLRPDDAKHPMRTYTVRAARPDTCEIDVDFVLHGADGPASAWALHARVGDELVITGPDARAEGEPGGVEWHPGSARNVVLAGDETAAPAICAILETLDPLTTGHALIEVPTAADTLEIASPSGVRVEWLIRETPDRAHPRGWALAQAVRALFEQAQQGVQNGSQLSAVDEAPEQSTDDPIWEVPTGDDVSTADAERRLGQTNAGEATYVWLAGEAGVITSLRRHLVRDIGIDRSTVAFMGYWRVGRAEGS